MNWSIPGRLLTGAITLAIPLVLLGTLCSHCMAENSSKAPNIIDGYRLVDWPELMPKEDLEALQNPPGYLDEIMDGSIEDQISSQVQQSVAQAVDSRYQQALVSTQVVAEFDGQPIRLPGFIVPITFNDERAVTQFFLVPYFGACIHVPPPPPNQIVFANYPAGLTLDNLYDPFWVSGTLKTTLTENEVATSAYALKVDKIESYY